MLDAVLPSSRMQRPDPSGMSRVAEATAVFWILKILTTGFGESSADWIMAHAGPTKSTLAVGAVLLGALVWQLRQERYRVLPYWFVVVMVGIAGTIFADVVSFRLHVPLGVSSASYIAVLIAVFWYWQRSEGTVAIDDVTTFRRELLYWAAVMVTFALGTAVGDYGAWTLGLGYLGTGLVCAGLILLPLIAHKLFGLGPVIAFWAAYVVTRPLGASFADWMAFPVKRGSLGFGLAPVSIVLGIMIAAFVAYLVMQERRGKTA